MKKSIKLLLAFMLFLGIANIVTAQSDKTSPTKSETGDYLEDKIQEVIGNYRTKSGVKLYYTNADFYAFNFNEECSFKVVRATVKGKAPDEIYPHQKSEISKWSNYADQKITFVFNPADISSISDDTTPNGEVGQIIIKLKSKNGEERWVTHAYEYKKGYQSPDHWELTEIKKETRQTDILYFTYYKGDPANYERIKKALLHLKELYTEKDLFDD